MFKYHWRMGGYDYPLQIVIENDLRAYSLENLARNGIEAWQPLLFRDLMHIRFSIPPDVHIDDWYE